MKKIVLILLLVITLSLSACRQGVNSKNENESSPNYTYEAKESKEFEDIYWQDTLGAISFLGYNQYDDLSTYSKSQEFIDYIEFYFPNINDFEIIDAGGDELYFIIPRFNNSNVVIRNTNAREDEDFVEKEFFNGKAKPILLQTNIGDLYPDTEIYISYENQDIIFFPSLSGEDSTIILPEYGIMDITFYEMGEGNDLDNNIFLLEGSWHCEYNNSNNEQKVIDIQFENYEFDGVDDWYEMTYWRQSQDQELEGKCYFRVPIDFWEPIDDENILLYFDLEGENNGELEKIFGKFNFEFIDSNTLIIEHVGYDPLNKGEENFRYEFIRSFG